MKQLPRHVGRTVRLHLSGGDGVTLEGVLHKLGSDAVVLQGAAELRPGGPVLLKGDVAVPLGRVIYWQVAPGQEFP